MSNVPFMQLYVSDYLGDTLHLTTEQHGAYLLLLMTMWRNGGSLQNDEKKLARISRVNPRRWHLISPEVMAFFDVDGDFVFQKRLVEEYKKATSISEKRSNSGKLGGISKSLKNKETGMANAKQMPKHSQIPDTISHIKDSSSNEEHRAKAKRVAHRIPDEWHVGEAEFAAAYKIGLTREEIQFLGDEFKDYWTSRGDSGAKKMDWLATWRNRCRDKVSKSKPRFQSHPKPKSEHVLRHEAFEREINKVINGDRNEPDSNVIDLTARDYRTYGTA